MMNYLKRRFSSSDIQGDLEDQSEQEYRLQQQQQQQQQHNYSSNNNNNNSANFTNMFQNFNRKGPSPSAPSSPSKNISFADSVINAARALANTNINGPTPLQSSSMSSSHHGPSTGGSKYMTINKEKTKILLVIDDEHTDWSKYFRNRKLGSDHDIRIEQAEFKDLNLAAYSDSGVMVDINVVRNGSKVVRSFKPDFVLIRQHVRDVNIDWKNIIIGLQYGNVPCMNSLYATYNFIDRAWVFSELVKINRKLGNDAFPLITQAYYPNHREMLTSSVFPCVVKIGNAHQGLGKVRVQNPYEFQDISSVVAISKCYSTTEPYIDCKCDIQIQKIGNHYKAFMRKSITNQWKANTGSAMLEQIPMNDRYRLWIDEVSKIFGGLDLCSVEAVMGNDSKEYIICANDSAFQLLGESQDDDRRMIAELVYERMMQLIQKPVHTETLPSVVKPNIQTQHVPAPAASKESATLNEPVHIITANIPPMTIAHPNNSNATSYNSPILPISSKESSITAAAASNNLASTLPTRQLPTIPNRQQPSPTRFNNNNNNNNNISAVDPRQQNVNNNNSTNASSGSKYNSLQTSTPSSSSSSIASTHSQPPPPSSKPNRPQMQPQLSLQHGSSHQAQHPLQQQQKPQLFQNQRPPPPQRPTNMSRESSQTTDDGDDTMKNLRKTFAGIFGDM